MSKRKSFEQTLIGFGYNAEEGVLSAAINTLTGLREARFPKAKKAAPRKTRADAGTKRTPKDDSKPNGGDEAGGE